MRTGEGGAIEQSPVNVAGAIVRVREALARVVALPASDVLDRLEGKRTAARAPDERTISPMLEPAGRNHGVVSAHPAEGWMLHRMTPPTRLYSANGLRTGADGRIYVAQVGGSQISAVDPDSGAVEVISPMGGGITAPDDLAFDEEGNLYATEITEGRVSVLRPNGTSAVVYGDLPVANPITYSQGRLIAGGCEMGAQVLELDRNGGAPRVIADNVPMPNAFEVGPDGKLYMPVMGANAIWRVNLDGSGEPEVVCGDLGVPDSVKFDAEGMIVSTQVASGQVLRIDPRTGAKTVLADIGAGLDNCTFVGDRLFISHILGSIHEITTPKAAGGLVKPLIEKGLQWPLDVSMGADGVLWIADGGFVFSLRAGEAVKLEGMLFSPNFPGYSRGVVAAGAGEMIVTTANGEVAKFHPAGPSMEVLASGFDQLMGVAIAPSGAVVFAEYGTGKVHSVAGGKVEELVSGLDRPKGVAVAGDGTVYVAESGAGRVVKLVGGRAEAVIEDLVRPEGLAIRDGRITVLDVKRREVVQSDLSGGAREVIAQGLPVGPPEGTDPKPLGGVGHMCGPMGNMTGLDVGPDGTVWICGDLEGSVLALRRA